jgi:DNA-binding response OmpR family regulator
MPEVLIVSDAPWVHDEVKASLSDPGVHVRELHEGREVLPALRERLADLVILDLQIGNMGGMATCLDVRLEEGAGRLPHVPVLMLLDREADVFLARRSGAEGWVFKPLDSLGLRRAIQTVLDGGTYPGGTTRSNTGPMVETPYVPTPDSTAPVPGPAAGEVR